MRQDTGLFYQKAQSRSMQEAMATDPTAMVDMMKRNLTGMVPQVRALHACMHHGPRQCGTICPSLSTQHHHHCAQFERAPCMA